MAGIILRPPTAGRLAVRNPGHGSTAAIDATSSVQARRLRLRQHQGSRLAPALSKGDDWVIIGRRSALWSAL
jgi:hypothetical protein